MSIPFRACAGWIVLAATAASVGLAGCKGSARGEQTDFISANPAAPRGDPAGDGAGGTSSGTGGGGGPDAVPVPPRGGAIAERAIRDADIVQEKDGRLYAMSRYSGLSIIDVSRRDGLRVLGTRRMHGTPVAMYLRDGIVYALFYGWPHVVPDAEAGASRREFTSRVEALDVSDPAEIQPVGSLDLPGKLTEARLTGDVLYAVTYEHDACLGCTAAPNTTVTSLAVGDPADIAVIDRLKLSESAPSGYWGWPSVSVSQDRVYVASAAWSGDEEEEGRATIQVVDISDPGGALVEGARVETTGQIENPWQMDEHDGVLRFVSLPGPWQPDAKPGIQTFSIVSSQEIVPLGATELDLHPATELRSVRFDGDRAYAVAVHVDPVLIVDLSDPANPAQVGGLGGPGWTFHVEPRGDRLFAFGGHNDTGAGSLHVSLFDVSDVANPTMLERVAFGGSRGRVVEEHDNIHEAFALFDSLGALAVPYRGSSREALSSDCDAGTTGVQLIDFTRDTLAKRGVAATRGQARRVVASGERLIAVSDLGVEAFGIEDRGAPAKVAGVALATLANSAVVVGDLVVRIGADTDTGGGAWLETASAASPGLAEPIARLDHAALFAGACQSYFENARLFAHGRHVYVLWPAGDYASTHLAIVDVGDPAAPRVISQRNLPFSPGALYYTARFSAVVSAGGPVVQAGSTLVIRHASDDGYYYDEEARPPHEAWLEILDLSDPLNPRHSSVELPEGAGHMGLQLDGTTVLVSRWTPLPDDPQRARFYLDRVDVADPSSPVVRASVSVPGSLLAFDGASGRLLTMDYETVEIPVTGREACSRAFASNAAFTPAAAGDDAGPGACRGTRRALKLLDLDATSARLRDESPVGDAVAVVGALAGEGRAFLSVQDGAPDARSAILVAGGLQEGSLETATQEIAGFDHRSGSLLLADGARLVVVDNDQPALSVLDATDLTALSFEKKSDLFAHVYHATLSGGRALCSSGRAGLEVVDVGP
ncbi:beta-propeller domain-containing protein [Sorangium sp. So ce134]